MHTPELPNYFALAWTLTNFLFLLLPVAILLVLIWYVRKKQAFQKDLLDKIDHVLVLLEKDTGQ